MLSLWRKQTIISRQALVTLSEATLSGDSSERRKDCLRRCHVAGGWVGSAVGERVRGDIVLKTFVFGARRSLKIRPYMRGSSGSGFFRMFSHYFHSEFVDSDM